MSAWNIVTLIYTVGFWTSLCLLLIQFASGAKGFKCSEFFIAIIGSVFSSIFWPVMIWSIFRNREERLECIPKRPLQFVILIVVSVLCVHTIWQKEYIQKQYNCREYWQNKIAGLQEGMIYNQRTVQALSRLDFHVQEQKEDLWEAQNMLKIQRKSLIKAKSNLAKCNK